MTRTSFLVSGFLLVASSAAFGQGRRWVLPVTKIDGCNSPGCTGGWTEETTGGYVGSYGKSGHYWWATAQNDVWRRAWWKFQAGNDALGGGPNFIPDEGCTTIDPPAEPRLYFIRTWCPPAHSSMYSVIEADVLGPDVSDSGGVEPRIPWSGAFGTNHSWLKRNPSNQGNWVQTGPGPQAPVAVQDTLGIYSSACSAAGTGYTVWLRKGDWLYVKWDFGNPSLSQGVSVIEITEANTIPPGLPPVATCSPTICGGNLDFRCIGNADPLYGIGPSQWWDSPDREPFADDQSDPKVYMIAKGDSTLAAEGYRRPCVGTAAGVFPGLPPLGDYTAHLAAGDVSFKLRYDGMNSMKWDAGDTNPSSAFVNNRVFTMNASAASEFVVRPYNTLYLLSTKNGNNGQLNVQLIYSDSTTTTTSVSLYDWFPGTSSDADPTSIAVGYNGVRKIAGGTGFKRIKADGSSLDAGTTSGAFLFVHPVSIDPSRNLSQIKLSISADGRGFGGNVVVFAGTLVSNSPAFDVVGTGLDGSLPDGYVDMQDFGIFQECYTGSAVLSFSAGSCACFDRAAPFGAIDAADLAKFTNCFTRTGIAATPGCDQ